MFAKIIDVIKFAIAFFWSLILRSKNIWIITERRAECKDNGYHLFKYIRNEHPQIQVYYAIDKNSNQRHKIEDLGNVLNFNSLKHYAYALSAARLIGAFLPCGIPDSICFYKFPKLVKGKKIFLQHGITKENIPSLHYRNTNVDKLICGAKPEYEFVKGSFGYPKGNVVYTGFARFDALKSEILGEKNILIMPTWRQYLPSKTWGGANASLESTQYFKTYNSLINNGQLLNFLENNKIKLIFYPHHEVQGNLSIFSSSSENVIIASEKDYDVQKLLKETSLLITDYSSVAFDTAYMNKPVVYYQFDEDEYYKGHYQKGYFDYNIMGFGPVCYDENSVVENIVKIVERNYLYTSVYSERINSFFELRDCGNCERIFKSILDC